MREKKLLFWTCFALMTPNISEGNYIVAQNHQTKYEQVINSKPLTSILKKIEEKFGTKIIFSYEDLDKYRVNASVKATNVTDALKQVLKGLPVIYTQHNGFISVKLKNETSQNVSTNGQATVSIIGKVIDSKGETIPSATIQVAGNPDLGVVTDANGRFSLNLNQGKGETLVVSYLGMKTTSYFVNCRKDIDNIVIKLEEDKQVLDDVVVTGIYTRKAESFTGSATTVSGNDLRRVGNQNILQSLKNLDPTVYIADNLTSGSDPNGSMSISMRGTSSFPVETSSLKSTYQNQPNEPLFILDGFETSAERIKDLDMNRVESITILKDASAKALYGSKAANGVIVIETKRLAGTEARITYNGSLDLEIPDLSSYDMTNAMEKLQVEKFEGLYDINSAYYNGGTASQQQTLTTLYNQRYKLALEGLDTDWMAKPLHTGVGQKHNINIELGDARNLRGILNFTYNDVAGVMKSSSRRNFSGDVSLSYRRKNLLFKNILSVVSNHSSDSPYGTFSDYVKMNPYWQAEDENGNILRWAEAAHNTLSYGSSAIANPLYDATIGTSLKSSYMEFVDNFYAEWNIIPDLKATLRIGAEQKRNDVDEFYPANHSRFASYTKGSSLWSRRGLYTMENGKQTQLSGDLNINYNHAFGKHHLFGNAGYFISETKYQAYQHQAEGFGNESAADITFAHQYAENTTPTGYASINREMSFLLSASYDYDDRYLVDLTERESASSLYGSDKRWANSWSVGLGWNLHNEPLLKNLKWLKLFKLRGSIGLTGNQNFNTNESITTYRYFTGVNYEGLTGAYLNVMPNPGLMWEQKKDYNFGFDFRAFGLSLTFDIYKADTKNMLTNVSIPTSTGFNTVKDNLGLVRNSGVEIKANYTPWQSKDGFVSVYGSFVYTKNRIVNLSESMREYNKRMLTLAEGENQTTPVLMYQDGLSMNTIWAVPSAGIDPQTGEEIYIKKDGTYTYTYDSSDMIAAGDATPKYRGNIGFNAEYKGIGLTATCTYLAGGQMYNSTLVDRVEDADMIFNVDRRVLTGRWQKPGDISQYKGYSSKTNTRATTRFVQDRNELTLSSISAYYEFPKSIYSKLYMQRLRFAVYLNDVATFSSVKVERGTSYPFARTLSFALSATF